MKKKHKEKIRMLNEYKYQSLVNGIKQEAIDLSLLIMYYNSLLVLRDEFGFGKKRLERFMDKAVEMLVDVSDERLDYQDMIETIEEETGYKITIPPRKYM